MDKFLPLSGGHPLFLDDLVLLQNSYAEALAGLVGYLNPTGNSILSGVIINTSGPTITYTAGFVAINGEIFKVQAGAFTNSFNPADQLYFIPVQTVLPPSPDTYEDQSLKNVHFQRQAILKYYNSSTDSGGAFYPLMCRADAGEIRDWVPPAGTHVTDFFDNTGLGIGAKLGWAIVNGLNGTPDIRGFVTACATNVPNSGSPALSSALNGVTNNIGDKEGSVLKTVGLANLPNVNLPVSDPGHDHATHAQGELLEGPGYFLGRSGVTFNYNQAGLSNPNILGGGTTPDNTMRTSKGQTGITVSTGGSGAAIDGRNPTFYVYKIMKLN